LIEVERHANDGFAIDDAGILEEDERAAGGLLTGRRVREHILEVPGGVARQLLDVDLGTEEDHVLEDDVAAQQGTPVVGDLRGIDPYEGTAERIDDRDV